MGGKINLVKEIGEMLLYMESYIASFCSFSCLDEVDVSKSKVGACSESAFFCVVSWQLSRRSVSDLEISFL